MNTKWKRILFAAGVALATGVAVGQELNVTTSLSGDGGITSVEAESLVILNSSTPGTFGYRFDMSLDSVADLLVVDAQITDVVGAVHNEDPAGPFGTVYSDAHPPFFGPLWDWPTGRYLADLWVTTGRWTGAASSASLVDGELVTHFDTVDDGAQSDFQWASLTLIPNDDGFASVTLNARFQTASDPNPVFDEVTVVMTVGTVPEPTTNGLAIVAILSGIGFVRRKRIPSR